MALSIQISKTYSTKCPKLNLDIVGMGYHSDATLFGTIEGVDTPGTDSVFQGPDYNKVFGFNLKVTCYYQNKYGKVVIPEWKRDGLKSKTIKVYGGGYRNVGGKCHNITIQDGARVGVFVKIASNNVPYAVYKAYLEDALMPEIYYYCFYDTNVINDEVNNYCYPYELPGDCALYESTKGRITIRAQTTTSAPKTTTKKTQTAKPNQGSDVNDGKGSDQTNAGKTKNGKESGVAALSTAPRVTTRKTPTTEPGYGANDGKDSDQTNAGTTEGQVTNNGNGSGVVVLSTAPAVTTKKTTMMELGDDAKDENNSDRKNSPKTEGQVIDNGNGSGVSALSTILVFSSLIFPRLRLFYDI